MLKDPVALATINCSRTLAVDPAVVAGEFLEETCRVIEVRLAALVPALLCNPGRQGHTTNGILNEVEGGLACPEVLDEEGLG